jgi:hypothetical protein
MGPHEARRASLLRAGWPTALLIPFAIAVIARTLAAFAQIIQPYLAIRYDLWFELAMVIGQVLFQWCVLWRRPWRDRLDYAVILIAVSSLGAALLWPLLLVHHLRAVTPLPAVLYFFAVVGVMFAAHWRMVARARLPTVLCATWVVYRLLILLVVVKRP